MVLAISAFNAAGRATNDTLENVGPKPIPKMIDHAYIETKRSIEVLRNEIEVNRLEILQERELIEQKKAEIEYERTHLDKEKAEFEKNGAK